MSYLTSADGVRLHYELEGSGPPLLLHLGSGCDTGLWRAAGYVTRLSETRTCILFDHRGHGRSDHPSGPISNHIDRFVADVVLLLDTLGIKRTAFWGYSTAIIVGLKVAEEYPQRIESLVMSGAIRTGTVTREELSALVADAVGAYRTRGWEALIEGFEADEGPVPEWMKDRIRATDLGPVIGWNEARPDWGWSAWEALPRVRAPGLFLVGALEDPDDTMAAAAARMPDGRRVRIPDKGHINGFLDRDFVLPLVLDFLSASATG